MKTRLIGFDISASDTGITVMDVDSRGNKSLVYVTHIETVPSKGKHKFSDGERLSLLRHSVFEILDRFAPQVFIKEGMGADMSKFRSVSLVSKATGIIEEVCETWKQFNQSGASVTHDPVKMHAYPPSTIKKAVTGYGGVDKTIKGSNTKANYLRKKPVIDAVLQEFGTDMYSYKLRKLTGDTQKEVYYNDNETDSTAVILTHLKLGVKEHV